MSDKNGQSTEGTFTPATISFSGKKVNITIQQEKKVYTDMRMSVSRDPFDAKGRRYYITAESDDAFKTLKTGYIRLPEEYSLEAFKDKVEEVFGVLKSPTLSPTEAIEILQNISNQIPVQKKSGLKKT